MNSIDWIIDELRSGPEERAEFVASHVDKGIAYQIRAIRDSQGLSQEELAKMVDMNQNAISRLESPTRGRPTITTLKRLAKAFDVALIVAFVPFTQLAKVVSGTPFVQSGLSTEYLAAHNFAQEEQRGLFGLAVKQEPVPLLYFTVISATVSLYRAGSGAHSVIATNNMAVQVSLNTPNVAVHGMTRVDVASSNTESVVPVAVGNSRS